MTERDDRIVRRRGSVRIRAPRNPGEESAYAATPPVMFVTCGIFREELDRLVREQGVDVEIVYLDAALHVNFDKLKARLVQALEENCRAGARSRVLYGRCHPEMDEILEGYGAIRIEARNCLEALVGAEELRRLKEEAETFFLSAGWVANWREMFSQGEQDFGLDFREMLRSYERAVVFDTDLVPIDEDRLQEFHAFTGLPIERVRVGLEHLWQLMQPLMGAPHLHGPTEAADESNSVCHRCGTGFHCGCVAGNTHCWCAELPNVLPLGDSCLCPGCLEEALKDLPARSGRLPGDGPLLGSHPQPASQARRSRRHRSRAG